MTQGFCRISRYQSLPASLRNDIWPVLIDNLSYKGACMLAHGDRSHFVFYNKQHFNEKESTPSLPELTEGTVN